MSRLIALILAPLCWAVQSPVDLFVLLALRVGMELEKHQGSVLDRNSLIYIILPTVVIRLGEYANVGSEVE